jgi:outer membrane receptor protein involved in Fe transport
VRQLSRDAQVRLQLQLYNIFNAAEFTTMNTNLAFQDDPSVPGIDNLLLTSTNHGRYTAANPPRQFGLTIRLDF